MQVYPVVKSSVLKLQLQLQKNAAFNFRRNQEAGIDIWSFNNLTGVFEKMRQENDGSIIIISHQERIFEIADEIIVLADGQISMQGKKEDVLPKLFTSEDKCSFCTGGIQ